MCMKITAAALRCTDDLQPAGASSCRLQVAEPSCTDTKQPQWEIAGRKAGGLSTAQRSGTQVLLASIVWGKSQFPLVKRSMQFGRNSSARGLGRPGSWNQWGPRLRGASVYAKRLLAGALSAVFSRTCVAPFERVKLEFVLHQRRGSVRAVAAEVLHREGWRGFWRGNGLNVLRTAPYKAVNFASYDLYRSLLRSATRTYAEGSHGSQRFVAGAMAGVTATIICFPLDVLRTRVMAPGGLSGQSPLAVLQRIVSREGFGALYVGCIPALVSMAPSGAVFYGLYDILKSRHLQALQRETAKSSSVQKQQQLALDDAHMLLYGALAGAAAEAATYPFEVVRRRMQLRSMALAQGACGGGSLATTGPSALAVAVQTAALIARTDGVGGFYVGILPSILQVLPSSALSYFSYERIKQLLQLSDN